MEKFVALKLALEKLAEEVAGEVTPYTNEEVSDLLKRKYPKVKSVVRGVGRGVLEGAIGDLVGSIPGVAYGHFAKKQFLKNTPSVDDLTKYLSRKQLITITGRKLGRYLGLGHGVAASVENTSRGLHNELMKSDPRYKKWYDNLPDDEKVD